MEKTITLNNGKEVTFKTSGALPKLYRMMYKKDIFVDMGKIKVDSDTIEDDTIETLENIGFAMARHGGAKEKDILEWLENFETFELLTVMPAIIELWEDENTTLSVPE